MKNCLETVSDTWTTYQTASIFNQLQMLTDIIQKQQNKGNSVCISPSKNKISKQHIKEMKETPITSFQLMLLYILAYITWYAIFFQNFNTVLYITYHNMF